VALLTIFVTRKQRGAGLLEFGVALAVIGVLAVILLQRLFYYQGEAERVGVEHTVANVRSALEIRVAQGRLPGGSIDLSNLAEQNPLNLLKNKPANYAGELFQPDDIDIGKGNWCFDRYDKSLIYLLNNGNSFGDASTKRLKYKVKLFRLPQSPAKPSGAPDISGVAFEQVKD